MHCQQVKRGHPSPFLSAGKTTPGVLHSVLSSSVQKRHRYTGILERVQQRDTSMIKGLGHLTCERRLRPKTIQPREEKAQEGILLMFISTWREGTKRTEPGAFQWCLITGSEAMGTGWNTGGAFWTSGNTFLVWRWWSTESRLPREVVKSQSLGILKKKSQKLGLGGPAWAGRLDHMTSRCPFQLQPLCEPVIHTQIHTTFIIVIKFRIGVSIGLQWYYASAPRDALKISPINVRSTLTVTFFC